MNTYTVFVAVALVAVAVAEPPSGYSYNNPSAIDGGTDFSITGQVIGGNSGNYIAESTAHQTSEGAHVDQVLLEKVRRILLQEEQNSHSSHIGGFVGGLSTQYGVPSPVYHSRVVGVDLEGIKQAIQVAQYRHSTHSHHTIGGVYPSAPSTGYGVPPN